MKKKVFFSKRTATGYVSHRVLLSVLWIRDMGITKENKDVIMEYDRPNNRIFITKNHANRDIDIDNENICKKNVQFCYNAVQVASHMIVFPSGWATDLGLTDDEKYVDINYDDINKKVIITKYEEEKK